MIPKEAIESAAQAMFARSFVGHRLKWHKAGLVICDDFRKDAQAALEAAAPYLRAQALEELLTPEALERARKVVEDELIEWRDGGMFVLRRNGLAIRNKDGSGSEIIRFGFEDGLRIAVQDHIARAVTERGEG